MKFEINVYFLPKFLVSVQWAFELQGTRPVGRVS